MKNAAWLILIVATLALAPWPAAAGEGGFDELVLLPILDLREFPAVGGPGQLEYPFPLWPPAPTVLGVECGKWKRLGPQTRIQPYCGPLPPRPSFKWPEFPLRGLSKDVGLGLTVQRLRVEKVDYNALFTLHALIDAGLSPLYLVGEMTSLGHFDLAGRMIPSLRVRTLMEVEVNLLSPAAGGIFFSKTYYLQDLDPRASDADLFVGYKPHPDDGQAYGRERLPKLTAWLVDWLRKDPEFRGGPRLEQALWLGRVLSAQRLAVDRRLAYIQEAASAPMPIMTPRELVLAADPNLSLAEKKQALSRPNLWPVLVAAGIEQGLPVRFVEKVKSRIRLMETVGRVFLEELARQAGKSMTRPPTRGEQRINQALMNALDGWQARYAANQYLRGVVMDAGAPRNLRRVAAAVLARSPQVLGNQGFLSRLVKMGLRDLKMGDQEVKRDAAAILVAVLGPNAVVKARNKAHLIRAATTGQDLWAGPWVLKRVTPGRYHPDAVRLAGAMGLVEAQDDLLAALKAAGDRGAWSVSEHDPPPVRLTPTDSHAHYAQYPAPVDLIHALGAFHGDPAVMGVLQQVADAWRPGRNDRLAAAAVIALGRVGHQEAVVDWVARWSELWDSDHQRVRQAVLTALKELGDPGPAATVLSVSRTRAEEVRLDRRLPHPQVPHYKQPLMEVVAFFGDIRHQPAADFLADVVRLPQPDEDLRVAAAVALGRLASTDAEKSLVKLVRAPKTAISDAAAAGLETLVRERALTAGR